MDRKVALNAHLDRLNRGEARKVQAAKKAGGSYTPKKFKITSAKEAKKNPEHVVLNLGSKTKTGYKTQLGKGAKLLRGQKVAPNIKTSGQTQRKIKAIQKHKEKGLTYTSRDSGHAHIDRHLTLKNMGKKVSYKKTLHEATRHLKSGLKYNYRGKDSLKSTQKARLRRKNFVAKAAGKAKKIPNSIFGDIKRFTNNLRRDVGLDSYDPKRYYE
jgi:hypothetical protein